MILSGIKRALVALIGYGVIFGVFGLLLVLLFAPISVYLNHNGVNSGPGFLASVQRLTYPYVRDMWNGQPNASRLIRCWSISPRLAHAPSKMSSSIRF